MRRRAATPGVSSLGLSSCKQSFTAIGNLVTNKCSFFLSTATYLIFGSWLNYNRYGARGLDLLPGGDTIRDLPYLAKDWSRRVLSTVQGGGSRGGYAAV